jgi:putative ubiquitin-RnfH superfamily antitoxin RatB of RatAB toxin-antitoxin module
MAEMLQVEVVCCLAAGEVLHRTLALPLGATVMDAIEASGFIASGAECIDAQRVGIFSHRASAGQLLRDGDRVELYRSLSADPKDARRLRASRRS